MRTASFSYVSENQFRCTSSNYAGVCLQNTYDYSPFGVSLDGRTMTSEFYRYGFQNQEKDEEFKGKGNSLNFEYRMHDPRVGRFFAVDILTNKYPWNSPYSFSENNLINAAELEGLERVYVYAWNPNKKKWIKKYTYIDAEANVDKNKYVVFNNETGKIDHNKTRYETVKKSSAKPSIVSGDGYFKASLTEVNISDEEGALRGDAYFKSTTAIAYLQFDKNSITSGSSLTLTNAGASGSINYSDLTWVKGDVNGSILNVDAQNNIGLEGMKYSVGFDKSISASVLKGDASATLSINGSSAKGTIGACVICGGAGANMNFGFDEKNNDFYLNLGGELGIGIGGVKLDLDIKIDL